MAKLIAYLHFDGNCREAVVFYKEIFGGKLELGTVGESPMVNKSVLVIEEACKS